MKPYKFILSATLLAMFATTLYGQEMRTFGVGIYDTIFNNSTDRLVQIEVYALGAGGGGQGGNQHQFSMSNGTGGAGGGGAAVYSKFAVTGPVQFNISVGSGGSGGGYRYVFTGDWQSGDGGGDGNPTIVTWNETNSFTVEGGKGAPRASRTDQSGGTGGRGNESIRPSVVPDNAEHWRIFDGENGGGGDRTNCVASTGGKAGAIPANTGSLTNDFGGGSGGYISKCESNSISYYNPGRGGGGNGGWESIKGNVGGDGQVIIVISPAILSHSMLIAIPAQEYTGQKIEPAVILKDGETILTKGTDYEVVYENNINVGTAKIIITSIEGGIHIGSFTANFTIHKAQGSGTVSIEGWKNGEEPNEPIVESTTNGTDNVTYLYKSTTGSANYGAAPPSHPGNYMLIATFPETDSYYEVKDTAYFTIWSTLAIPVTVNWNNDTLFTYNKMVQAPVPTLVHNGDTIALILVNAQSEVGKYDGMLKAKAIIEEDSVAQNFILNNSTKSYEIIQKSLLPHFKVNVSTEDFATNADTIWVPTSIFSDSTLLRDTLTKLIDYYGFATDTIKNETDDATVLKGKPTITLQYDAGKGVARYAPALAKRVETTQKATATIITDDVSAKNYVLDRSIITVMEAIAEADGITQIFCKKNSKYVRMGANSCQAINGEVFETIFCVIDEECRPITDDLPIAACTEFGYEIVQICGTPITHTSIQHTLKIWQNTSGTVQIDIGYMPTKPITLQIYNLKGKLIATEQINSRYANVRINFANGIYLFKAGNHITRMPIR